MSINSLLLASRPVPQKWHIFWTLKFLIIVNIINRITAYSCTCLSGLMSLPFFDVSGNVWYNCPGGSCGNYCTYTHTHPTYLNGIGPIVGLSCTDYCVPCVDGCLTCGSTTSCLVCESDYAFFSSTDCRSCASLYNTGCVSCNTSRCLTCSSGYGFNTTASNFHII
jgi:hypothetical protein